MAEGPFALSLSKGGRPSVARKLDGRGSGDIVA
jgi:hypothetical protein